MKLTRDEEAGAWTLEITDPCFVHTVNDWRDLIAMWRSEYNWYTFRMALIEFERDDIVPGYECTLLLLGLGLRFRYNTDWDGTRVAEILDDLPAAIAEGRTEPLDEALNRRRAARPPAQSGDDWKPSEN